MSIKMIPKPKKISEGEGRLCIRPVYSVEEAGLEKYLHAFSDFADRVWGICFTPSQGRLPDKNFTTPLTEGDKDADEKTAEFPQMVLPGETRTDDGLFVCRDASLSEGAYRLHVGKTCIVAFSDTEGLTNALSSIIKLGERTCDKYISLPVCDIENEPDSSFRALQLDVARKWHPVDFLYRYVDLASLLNINRFIIHFTDDESYTLPSKIFPKLPTENRHYTESELKALADYAEARGVIIIPEIDMPGHCAQFNEKYPEVFGTYGILEADEAVFSALEQLCGEVSELFCHSEYIHLGGDEAVLGRWLDSEKSVEYMKKNGIDDIVKLYGHFVGRMCRFVLSSGKIPIVWEGFRKEANGFVPKETLVVAWESHYQLAPELVEAGFTVLNASWKPLYVVSPWQKWSPREILEWNKYKWDHWWEQSAAYGGGKVFVDETAPVDGGILCAWGDYLKNYESCRLACQLELKCVIPRLCALAEKLWTTHGEITPEEFESTCSNLKNILSTIWSENPFRGEL